MIQYICAWTLEPNKAVTHQTLLRQQERLFYFVDLSICTAYTNNSSSAKRRRSQLGLLWIPSLFSFYKYLSQEAFSSSEYLYISSTHSMSQRTPCLFSSAIVRYLVDASRCTLQIHFLLLLSSRMPK